MKKQYLNIEIETEGNIGVIEIDTLDQTTPDLLAIEKPLVEALSQHFDCEVKIQKTLEVTSFYPIKITANVVIDSDGGDYGEVVTLAQTWLYK